MSTNFWKVIILKKVSMNYSSQPNIFILNKSVLVQLSGCHMIWSIDVIFYKFTWPNCPKICSIPKHYNASCLKLNDQIIYNVGKNLMFIPYFWLICCLVITALTSQSVIDRFLGEVLLHILHGLFRLVFWLYYCTYLMVYSDCCAH